MESSTHVKIFLYITLEYARVTSHLLTVMHIQVAVVCMSLRKATNDELIDIAPMPHGDFRSSPESFSSQSGSINHKKVEFIHLILVLSSCIYIYMYMYIYIMYTYMYIHVYICIYRHIFICIYIYTLYDICDVIYVM